MPHLRRAYHLHRTLDQARRDRETLEEALHAVRQPVLVVEADGRLLFANQEAKRLLAMEDGVKLSAGCVVAAHRADRPALAALLRPMDPASGDTVIAALRRPGRQRPLLIEAMPLRQRGRWEPPSRVVLLIDSRAMQRPAPEDLAGLYDLTPAEARLWSGLAGGATLAEIAVRHRVSVNTLRVQLGRLFRKVGVHRQADLVRRALEFTGPRDDPGVPEPRRE
jgi:DNA-binding CsgD family transcriptional regulator